MTFASASLKVFMQFLPMSGKLKGALTRIATNSDNRERVFK